MIIKSSEFIILQLPPTSDNNAFIYQTFGITQYVFYDERFPTSTLKNNELDKFDKKYYDQFREKCLKIKNVEVSFTIDEFIFLSKTIDFVSKCFIGKPKEKLHSIFNEDFAGEYDFNMINDWYLMMSAKFFKEFRASCKNKEIRDRISKELKWDINIW